MIEKMLLKSFKTDSYNHTWNHQENEVCGPVSNREHDHPIASHEGDVPKPQVFSTTDDYSLPPPPSLGNYLSLMSRGYLFAFYSSPYFVFFLCFELKDKLL